MVRGCDGGSEDAGAVRMVGGEEEGLVYLTVLKRVNTAWWSTFRSILVLTDVSILMRSSNMAIFVCNYLYRTRSSAVLRQAQLLLLVLGPGIGCYDDRIARKRRRPSGK